jgi:hypothetical protein
LQTVVSRLTRAGALATVAGVIVGGAAACKLPPRATPGPAKCNDAKVRHDLHAGRSAGIVVGGFGAPAPGCQNNYALVDICKYTDEPCGDSTGLARFAHDEWTWYAFFPTNKCVSTAKADRVPTRWQSGFFRDC